LQRVLLLYSPDHSGHKMAATALREVFHLRHPEIEVRGINLIKYTNPLLGAAASKTYLGLIRNNPALWRYFYDNPGLKRRTEKLRDLLYLSSYVHLRGIVEDYHPDVVVCTQAFPCIIVDKYKNLTGKKLPLVGVVTDFFANLYWKLNSVDLFCVATEESKHDFIHMGGASPEKIEVTGIPIRPRFETLPLRQAPSANGSPKTVLLMGGVRGLGPIFSVAEKLCGLRSDVRVTAVAGRNKRLRKKLESLRSRYPDRIEVLTYVDNVHELMAASDLLVSKAGGITTSECLARKLPMVLVSPIPGQEMKNAALLVKKKVAVLAGNADAAARAADLLLGDDTALDAMRRRMVPFNQPDSSSRVVEKVVALCSR
jgi:processive 1,2-diacylglycerol beta-glucosyltransferase